MPQVLAGNKSIEEQIPHGEHLTWVDKLRAMSFPDVNTNENGQTAYPKTEYLKNVAAKRYQDAKDAPDSGS